MQSQKDGDRDQSDGLGVLTEQPNQIINLKAPTQFERDDYDNEILNEEKDEFGTPHKMTHKEFGYKKHKSK